jgi:hypothetical protein
MKVKSVETDKQLEKELAQCRADAGKLETMTMEEAVSVTTLFFIIVVHTSLLTKKNSFETI